MDSRSPYLHHNRYSSHSFRPQSQPQFHSQPRPHPNFHSNPNLNASHHSPLPAAASSPPLRPPPPPPQTQFHHAPAQPQFNPPNPSFGYNPNNISYSHHRSHPDAANFVESPRVLQQKPSENDISRRLQDNVRDNRTDSRELPRVSDRWPPERPYSSANLNLESYRRQLVSQTASPIKIRQGLEGNSMFLEERNVSMVMRRVDDNYHRRFQFGTNSERSLRDSRVVSNQMNHSSSFESSRGVPLDDRVSGKQRWADGREVATDLRNSFIERGSHEVGVHERVQHSGKHQNYRSREDLERHTGKGSREGSFEHSRTPRKLPQKKSALLRLQKPNFRYREEERVQFYFDENKSMLSRVKDQISYSDQGMEQQLRQGSPVELDVSFKSNSLVAKAIVTPPSSSAVVSDLDDKPRSGKKRKLLVHHKDNSNISSTKYSEKTEKLDSVISATNDTSTPDLGLNQLNGESIASGTDNLHNLTSVAASSAIHISAKVIKSKKDGTSVAVAKTSCKGAKKKKIVKKVVKKVANSHLSSSSSQPDKACDGTIVPDGPADGLPDSPKPENDAVMASPNAFDSQLCTNKISLTPQNDKFEGSCDATASQNGAEASSDSLCPSNMKRKRSGSASPISSSGHEETQINEDKLKANSVDLMHAILNTDMDNILAKEILNPEVDNIEDVDKQRHELDNSLLLEKNEANKFSNMLLQSKDNADCDSSSPEEMKILKGQPNSFDMVSGYGSDHSLMNYGGGSVSGNAVTDSGCKEHCLGQDSPLAENGNELKISNASCMDHSRMIEQSNSGDTTIQNVAAGPSHSMEGVTMLGSDNAQSLVEEGHGVTNVKHLSPERVSMRVDGVSSRESPNFNVCRGVSEENTSNSKMSEENIKAFKGNLSNSVVNELCLGTDDIVQPACRVDTTLRLSSKECSGLVAGGKPCRNVVSVLPEEISNYVKEDFIAPPKLKQSKLSGSELKLPCTSDMNERPIISHISEAREAVTDPLSISDFPPSQKDGIASLPNHSGGKCRSAVDSMRDSFDNDELRSVQLCLTTEELVFQKVQPPKPSQLEAEQIVDVTTDLEGSSEGEKMVVDSGEGKLVLDSVTSQCEVPLEIQSLQSDERPPAANVESERSFHVKNDLSSLSKYLPSPRDGDGVSVPNSSIEVLELVPGTLSDTGYMEASPDILSMLDGQFSVEKAYLDDKLLGLPTIQGGSDMSPLISDPQNADISINSDQAVEKAHQFSVNTGTYGNQNQPAQAVSRNSGSSSLAFATSKKAASSTPPTKPRVWHQTDNVSSSAPPASKAVSTIVPKQRQLPQNVPKSQSTSYIRKGNSLVRKPSAVATQSSSAHNSNSLGADEAKKNAVRNNKTIAAEPSKLGRNSANVSFEMPRTPPLPTAKPNHSSGSLGEFMASLEPEPVNNIVAESISGPVNVAESNDAMKFSEDTIKASENPTIDVGLTNIIDSHNNPNDGNLLSSNGNSITYVKRKSNQLVATSNPHVPVNNSNTNSAGPSDGYFKRRKHQLIRTSLEGQPMARFLDGSVNSDEVRCNGTLSKFFTKRQFSKVVRKTCRPSKLSLVWTLRSSQLSNVNGSLARHQKIWPRLCPWKRATYLKNSVPNVAASLISSSSSTMSRKLLLLRKRDTVYTRSKHGFSLRKSKVLSVGGSSLKWSKSIESRSKKANEEATLAVAEAERKKREQSCASRLVSRTKNNSSHKAVQSVKLHTGERIFRIGSVCYKMDSSRRTLQRVSDDDSSRPAAGQTEKDARVYYVPRRLVIGKDEYVRIGNGNQLVRDPKRRTRILASEKVRWSLHTARSRLARKRKYCQFFTRFGKCNKDDGKCHYIHDSSKIAVCTKFLKGLCSNADCKLTHKVIPERMPDCSYFLQGICSNKNCPYRHVHVNPNASTCEGFLRGYCADGDECRKKHSYVCPTYEATGSCPQGSKCKLHHPKKRGKGKKIKRLLDKKNGHGRYFGSMHSNVSEPGTTVTKKCTLQGTSDLADYISLDFDEEDGAASNQVDEEMYISDGDPMDFLSDGLDYLIKPIRIMNG